MRWLVTVGAAVLLGVGFALQQRAAQRGPAPEHPVHLVVRLLRRRAWLVGVGAMVAGQLISAWALGHWQLTFVEPVLAVNLVFALAAAVLLSRQWLRAPEVLGALLLCAGVAAFTVIGGGYRRPGSGSGGSGSWLAAAAVAGQVLLLVWRGWRREPYRRATLVGGAAGLVFGIQDALTRRVVHLLTPVRWSVLVADWAPYALLAAAVVGLVLVQSAFGSAPLRASLPAVTAAEPVAGMVLGVVVFGDPLPGTAAAIAAEVAGFGAIIGGLVLVARAPALVGARSAHHDRAPGRAGRP